MNLVFVFCFICIIYSKFFETSACKGCVNLDEYSFDKIVPKFEAILVKFDVAYPYGPKQDSFESLAAEVVHNKNFLLAQVGIKDYGEKENEELAKKYGVNNKDDLPMLKLFVQGEDEPFSFEKKSSWTDEDLRQFVRDHTNIYLGLQGCLEEFDKLAMKFVSVKDPKSILKETEDKAKNLTNEKEKSIANVYVKFMNKVTENGADFIKQEITRLGKIIRDGKVKKDKLTQLTHRLNILKSFLTPSKTKIEL